MNQARIIAKSFFIFCILAIILELFLSKANIPAYVFPKPSDIGTAVVMQRDSMATAWGVTISEAMTGLIMAVVISSFLASATVFLPKLAAQIINTFGVALQSTPLLAIAPLLSLWFGQSFTSKAFASCIVCFFPLLTGWLTGLRSVDMDRLQLFENLNASRWQRAIYLIIPCSLPYFFGGLRVAMPLALLGAIVAEFVGASEGLGFQIMQNSYYVRTPTMFAYVLISALTGLALTLIISLIERRTLFWHGDLRNR